MMHKNILKEIDESFHTGFLEWLPKYNRAAIIANFKKHFEKTYLNTHSKKFVKKISESKEFSAIQNTRALSNAIENAQLNIPQDASIKFGIACIYSCADHLSKKHSVNEILILTLAYAYLSKYKKTHSKTDREIGESRQLIYSV